MKKISLSIPKPCHQNWDAMTAENKGRFCGSCQKTVIDFSTMSDRQLAEFFKKPGASVCGRFYPDQLERNIEIPRKRIPWVKYFFQFTWPAFVLFLKSCGAKDKINGEVMAKTEARKMDKQPAATLGYIMPEMAPVDALKEMDTAHVDSRMIVGEIAPSPAVLMGDTTAVQVPEIKIDSVIVPDHTVMHTMGAVMMPFVKCKRPEPKNEAAGKQAGNRRMKIDEIKKDKETFTSVPLVYKPIAVDEPLQNPEGAVRNALAGFLGRVEIIPMDSKTDKTIQKEKVPDRVKPLPGFLIYPNPATSNAALTMELKNAENGMYGLSVINSAGDLLQRNELFMDKKPVTVNLNRLSPGAYFIRLISKKTGKDATQTLIVQ